MAGKLDGGTAAPIAAGGPGSDPGAGARPPPAGAAAADAATRVLVVDDHEQLAAMTRLALEWVGYRVEVAGQGWRALAVAERFRPDVVVCDLNLPDIDGGEVARRLRAGALGRCVVLIACSGALPDDDGAALLAAGFDGVLAKPVDIQRLLAAIRAAGAARSAAQA